MSTWPGERSEPLSGAARSEPLEEIEQDEPLEEAQEHVVPTELTEEQKPEPVVADAVPLAEPELEPEPEEPQAEAELEPEEEEPAELSEELEEELPQLRLAGHAPGELDIPDEIGLLEGAPTGGRRGVGIVAARFNGDVTNRLLESALAELDRAGVVPEAITVVPVPGAFELPLAAMALAKTRRYACIVALGCVIRGETAHFDYVAGEASSGLQLAALETGVPVAFGLLTVDTLEQALARADKGAEAARTALEMADLFSQLRAQAR
jgi:6,7-dimethyl-8-ribityllumazine synthase